MSYQVSINGQLAGYAPNSVFVVRGLDTDSTYTAEVKTAWQDGTISERKAQISFSLKDLLPAEISLSELEPVRLTPGWRQPEMNRTTSGKGLILRGNLYERGIGMPSSSEVEFDLRALWDNFSAIAGIDDGNTRQVGVDFVVLGDGKELWRRDGLKKADGPVPVDVRVSGVRKLTLRVKGTTTERCDWGSARLSRRIGVR
ncbi:MAG TPA: NPCBM/NEW2 domain-containing protein [Blastocatellia bacterium]|nr:NPCBM/NEW2 domain-containing protein [Blastocatellia bacterium]